MRPTIRCTETRKGGSSTAITTATATCRSTYSVGATCWRPGCSPRAWGPRRMRLRRWRALLRTSAGAGRAHAFLLRADSGFAQEALMAWCEANGVHFLFGLQQNTRLVAEIESELAQAGAKSRRTGKPARYFKEFKWTTRRSWSRERRVVAKAEFTGGEANPRFVVTSLKRAECKPKYLYEKVYCARGDMENRIKECQLDLYADRTSTATMRANQLRLWFASMAYVLLCAVRRIALHHTPFANASCGTIRLKLLKIGALVRVSVRRIKIAMASSCPAAHVWGCAATRLNAAASARGSPA